MKTSTNVQHLNDNKNKKPHIRLFKSSSKISKISTYVPVCLYYCKFNFQKTTQPFQNISIKELITDCPLLICRDDKVKLCKSIVIDTNKHNSSKGFWGPPPPFSLALPTLLYQFLNRCKVDSIYIDIILSSWSLWVPLDFQKATHNGSCHPNAWQGIRFFNYLIVLI